MGSVNARRTGYTPSSSSSASSMQWDSDMYLGSHLGVAQFNSSVNALTGLSAGSMGVITFVANTRVRPVNEGTVTNNVTVSVGSTCPNYRGSSLPTRYTSGSLAGSSNTSGAYKNFDIRGIMNSPNGTTTNLTPTSNPIYVCFKKDTSNRFHNTTENNKPCILEMTGVYNYTNCGAPGSVSISRSGTTVTVTWTAGSAGNNVTIGGYYCILVNSTSSTSALKSASTNSSTLTATFTNCTPATMSNNSTIYARVCTTSGSPTGYNSGYTNSGACTLMAHPTVTAGTVITKAQMDSLRTYKGNTPTAVTQYATIAASVGTTYSSASAGNSITASWYNNA